MFVVCQKMPEELPEESGDGVLKNSGEFERIVLESSAKQGILGAEMVRVLPLEPFFRLNGRVPTCRD